jgi:proliferating cell nuclear antigen
LTQKDTGNEDAVVFDVEEPVALSFAARYLNLFSKAGSLSTQVILNMSNETPLMVNFSMPNEKGEMKFYLAPKITEEEM